MKILSNASLRARSAWQSTKYLALGGLFISLPLLVSAGGLELYSYHDEHGQLVVVDSLDRIPPRFRSKAVRNFIPSFKDNSAPKINTEAVNKVKFSNETEENSKSFSNKTDSFRPVITTDSNKSTVDVVDAPDEVEPPDPGLDEAAEVIRVMSAVVENNKQIYNLVLSTKLFSPATKNIHTQNVALLAKIKNPNYINWKRKHSDKSRWCSNAALLLERFRTIQYTVSKWFGEAPGNLLYGFPAFIKASEGHLRELNSGLEALKNLDKELVAQESKKKKKK